MYQKTTLDNGLRVLTSYYASYPFCLHRVFVGVGSRYESDVRGRHFPFYRACPFSRHPSRPTSQEISEAIEGIGGILNGATDKELTFYWCKVTREHFRTAAEVLVDMLLNSKFES